MSNPRTRLRSCAPRAGLASRNNSNFCFLGCHGGALTRRRGRAVKAAHSQSRAMEFRAAALASMSDATEHPSAWPPHRRWPSRTRTAPPRKAARNAPPHGARSSPQWRGAAAGVHRGRGQDRLRQRRVRPPIAVQRRRSKQERSGDERARAVGQDRQAHRGGAAQQAPRRHPSARRTSARLPVSAAVAPADAADLCQCIEGRRCEPGEVICREGEDGGNFYVILSGLVECTFRNEEDAADASSSSPSSPATAAGGTAAAGGGRPA